MEAELDLKCTFCGGRLYITLRSEGSAYLQHEVPDLIECLGKGCYAEWDPDGTLRAKGDGSRG